MALLNPNADDFCPCGSPKRYKRCHGDPSTKPEALEDNRNIDALLLALAYNVLRLLKDAIESVRVPDIHSDNAEEVFRKRTLLYFAKKVYRATLAAITLLRMRQSTQAFTLKRDQHHAYVAFHYYYANETESLLFMASGPLRQRDHAKMIMTFDEKIKNDPKRQAQLKEHEQNSERLYKRFPGLQVHKGKSSESSNPVMIDWSEPSEFDMLKAIVRTWPDELAQLGKPIQAANLDEWVDRETRKAHFFHSGFPSFDMHATPMGLIGDLNDELDEGTDLRIDSHEPNALLCIYLFYPIATAKNLVDFSGARGFKDRLIKTNKALKLFADHFDANPS